MEGYRETILAYMTRYRAENRDRLNRQQRERKAYYRLKGICTDCMKARAMEGRTRCEDCLRKQRERYRKRAREKREATI